jgi:hypothetical protein
MTAGGPRKKTGMTGRCRCSAHRARDEDMRPVAWDEFVPFLSRQNEHTTRVRKERIGHGDEPRPGLLLVLQRFGYNRLCVLYCWTRHSANTQYLSSRNYFLSFKRLQRRAALLQGMAAPPAAVKRATRYCWCSIQSCSETPGPRAGHCSATTRSRARTLVRGVGQSFISP